MTKKIIIKASDLPPVNAEYNTYDLRMRSVSEDRNRKSEWSAFYSTEVPEGSTLTSPNLIITASLPPGTDNFSVPSISFSWTEQDDHPGEYDMFFFSAYGYPTKVHHPNTSDNVARIYYEYRQILNTFISSGWFAPPGIGAAVNELVYLWGIGTESNYSGYKNIYGSGYDSTESSFYIDIDGMSGTPAYNKVLVDDLYLFGSTGQEPRGVGITGIKTVIGEDLSTKSISDLPWQFIGRTSNPNSQFVPPTRTEPPISGSNYYSQTALSGILRLQRPTYQVQTSDHNLIQQKYVNLKYV